MITLITGGQFIHRKALLGSVNFLFPSIKTVVYTSFDDVSYNNVLNWYDFKDDIYFLIDDKSKDFDNILKIQPDDIVRHLHVVDTYDGLFVYEFDSLTVNLNDIQTLRAGKKWVFNPNYVRIAMRPYVNVELFKLFKTLCYFVYMGSIIYSMFAIFYYPAPEKILIASLSLSCLSATFLLTFGTFAKVIYE